MMRMKVGPIIVGIVLMVIGVIGFTSASNSVSEGQTFVGQAGRAFMPQQAQNYQIAQFSELGFGGLAVIGLGLLIYGAVASSKKSDFQCSSCGYVTKDKDRLQTHYQREHVSNTRKENNNDMPLKEKNLHYIGLLKERLAKGEITKEEYDSLKKEFE